MREKRKKMPDSGKRCPVRKKCGGCSLLEMEYSEQLKRKEDFVRKTLKGIVKPEAIIGMENPWHYRNKIHASFARKRDGSIVSGIYEEGTHRLVPVEDCLIQNERANRIVRDLCGLFESFKIKVYNEDTGYGLVRHVLIRTGHVSGEVMVVLVCVSPVFPSKRNFVNALRKLHPEVTTVVLNVNDRRTSMVLGKRDIVLYGKGYIEDQLCGCTFAVSPQSFYQVNPVQTEILYRKAIEFSDLHGTEKVLDAYCGTGTIGLIAVEYAGEVTGVELNPEAVRNAVSNAKRNQRKNIRFVQGDAGEYMQKMAAQRETMDVVLMDPPRAGSDEAFLSSLVTLAPEKVVYISCNPVTLARDLKYLGKHGYRVNRAVPVDMFPWTAEEHVETVVLLSRI
ncbi:MAG: 23S rRNA (uracil(1939)-C(5))-methyltransferase RlmD [Lachnospiraceae bacterium]|nr:23S rRNA (uracil(1939)-C(5))-methyltransferase RlmD [Lachnospiraceae bacterium]